jgi:hypothetical protein
MRHPGEWPHGVEAFLFAYPKLSGCPGSKTGRAETFFSFSSVPGRPPVLATFFRSSLKYWTRPPITISEGLPWATWYLSEKTILRIGRGVIL